jgi:hypothetical protein
MSDQPKPLPFVYQFIAGAVAGVSEVYKAQPSNSHPNVANTFLDSCHVHATTLAILKSLPSDHLSGTHWMS